MTTYHRTIHLDTGGRCDILDITSRIAGIVGESALTSGICTVFSTGSTCSIITIEYEDGLLKDFPRAMERIAPENIEYEHHLRWGDGNGHSHIRASIVGPSLSVPFVDRKLTLGTWQQIAFVDFDVRARKRTVEVMLVGE